MLSSVAVRLRHLDLSRNSLRVGPQLARALGAATALRRLQLSSNRIDDGGAAAVAKLLPALCELRHLDVSWNQFISCSGRIECVLARS